ncbi:hypothetical protein DFR67_105319 [Williamsia limnetica]|uniref:Fe/B12 periplasmic-binding domain-containing protein n=1 Tax=Williamsia limnetica TaxID=882452 RepID=A0A318RNL7_WILLI|nr:ABC transporter substrate-binding protein [Williamsia limnetica]PYE18174.1 hypothetical protein DFR67_105319 [Williamsia limnetica]
MLSDYDVIVYPTKPDGTTTPEVQAMLDSELFKSLPAVQAGRVLPVAYTDPFTYSSGQASLDSLEEQLAKLPLEAGIAQNQAGHLVARDVVVGLFLLRKPQKIA